MLKQYLDYKRKQVDEMIASPLIPTEDKQRAIYEYNSFIASAFSDEFPGRIMLNKKMVDEVMTLAKSGKIPLVLDGLDIAFAFGPDMPNVNGDPHPFKQISDLVAVHKSIIPPSGDKIVTRENNGGESEMVFTEPSTGKMHRLSYPCGGDTIHFTLNCAVQNHEVGNDWDSYKYAVMIGLDKLDKSKILDVKSEDTYVDGDAELGEDYIIFCPLGERDKIQEENPNAMVIEYTEISLNDAIAAMIAFSGRKVEIYGTYGWERNFDQLAPSYDNRELDALLAEKDYPNLQGQFGSMLHSESKYMARRMWKREYEAIIALLEYTKDNNIDMPADAVKFLIAANGAYAIPGLLTVSVDNYKEFVVPILEKHGYSIEGLFDGINPDDSGLKYISHFADSGSGGLNLPSVNCPEWENELRDRVINIVMGNKKVPTIGDELKGNGK